MSTREKTSSKHIATAAALLALALTGGARAQSAGGFSAGPGLQPTQPQQVPAPETPGATAPPATAPNATAPNAAAAPAAADAAHDADAKGGDFRTDVTSFKPSPQFTQIREFTTTRLWVLDPGQFNVEQWWNGSEGASKALPGPNQNDQFFQTEIEMGVAKHVQVDIYANYQFNQDPTTGNYRIARGEHTGVAAEVRIALGSYWGQIWGNPTLYFELTSQYYNSPRAETRLLLGGNIFSSKLLGALNLGFERNIFRDANSGIDYEMKADYGLNYEIIPDIFRIGVEGILGFDSHGITDLLQGGVPVGGQNVYPVAEIGPSVILMEPHARIKVLATMLFGLAQYDAPYQPTVIVSSSF